MIRIKITASLLAIITASTGFMPVPHALKPDNVRITSAVCEGAWEEPEGWCASFATPDGNGWLASGNKWKAGRQYAIVFDNNGTKTVYDDEIVAILPCSL